MTNIKQKHDMFTMAEQSRIPLFLVGRLLIFKKTFVLMILTPLKKSFWSCTFKFFIYSKRFYKKSHQKCLFAWKLQIQILFSEFHQRFGTHELILTRNVSRLAISLSILKIKIRVRKLPRGKVMLSADFSSGS